MFLSGTLPGLSEGFFLERMEPVTESVFPRSTRAKHGAEHPSEWAAIESIAGKPLGLHGQTLPEVDPAGPDTGQPLVAWRPRNRTKELEREVRELKRINDLAQGVGCAGGARPSDRGDQVR